MYIKKSDNRRRACVIAAILLFMASSIFASKTGEEDLSFDFGITRNKELNLWPLLSFYKSKDSAQLKIDAAFSLLRHHKNSKTPALHSHLFPLYWLHDTPRQRDLRLGSIFYPSLFHFFRNKDKGVSTFALGELAPYINLMKFSRSQSGLYLENNLLFLLWFKNDKAKQRSHLIFFPFLWMYNNPLYRTTTLFPLASWGSYHHRRNTYTTITPLYWHFRSNTFNNHILFPVYWNLNNRERSTLTIPPLYFRSISKHNKYRKLMLSPLYWNIVRPDYHKNLFLPFWFYERKGIGAESESTLLTLSSYWRSKQGNRISQGSFPLWWHWSHTSDEKRYSYQLFLPFFFSAREPGKSYTNLFPFLSISTDSIARKKSVAVTPLFKHTRYHDGYKNRLFPLWYQGRFSVGESFRSYHHFPPLYFSSSSKDSKKRVLFPLLWYFQNKTTYKHGFLPFYYFSGRHDGSSRLRMLSPIYWDIISGGTRQQMLFPFWFLFSDNTSGKEAKSNTLFPFFWARKTAAYQSLTVPPLFSYGFSKDYSKRHLVVSPLYWDIKRPDFRRNVFFPLWWSEYQKHFTRLTSSLFTLPGYWRHAYNHQKKQGLFPFWWHWSDIIGNKGFSKHFVLPSFYSSRGMGRSYTGLFPLFSLASDSNKRSASISITPLYKHTKLHNGYKNRLFPLWFQGRYGTGDSLHSYNNLFPLYFSSKSKNAESRTLFPLLWYSRNKTSYKHGFLPFYFLSGRHDGSARLKMLSPIYWDILSDDAKRQIMLPFWFKKRYGKGDSSCYYNHFLPLYFSSTSALSKNRVLFPLYWNLQNKEHATLGLLPFYLNHKRHATHSRLQMITPFYWSQAGDYSSLKLLAPFWFNRSKTNNIGTYKKSFLFPNVFYSSQPSESYLNIFPFYSRGRDSISASAHFTLTPLFKHKTHKNGYSNRLFPLWYQSRFGTGNLLRYKNIVLPLYYGFKDRYYSSSTLFPLYSTGYSTDGERRHLVITPLYWNLKNERRRTTTLFPLYNYYQNNAGLSKFDLMYILYRRRADTFGKSVSMLWPLIHRAAKPDYSYFRLTPIVWYKKTPDRGYFSIQPFFYTGRSKESKSFNILWQLYNHQNHFGHKTSNSLLLRFLHWESHNNGDGEFRVAHKLFVHKSIQGKVEKSFFPFYAYRRNHNGERSFSLLFNLYKFSKKKLPDSGEFYQEEKIFWFLRLRSNYHKLKAEGKL